MTSQSTAALLKRIARHFSKPPRLTKLATHIDLATQVAHDEYFFATADNRYGTVLIERGKTAERGLVLRVLLNQNADLPTSIADARPMLDRAIDTKAPETIFRLPQVGWHEGDKVFCLHSRVLGTSPRRLRPPRLTTLRHRPERSGTLEEWSKVGHLTRYSSRLTLALSATFAAPLLKFSGLQPFGIMFYGRSKSGKTTIVVAAASVMGMRDESQLPNWDITDAAFQELASASNDHLLPLNELAVMRGGANYERIAHKIYAYSEGQEVRRHSASGVASEAAGWRGIFLATSEESVSALAAKSGATRAEGEYARCIDVPVTRQGKSTAFDRAPDDVLDRDAWARSRLSRIRTICASHRGVALEQYVTYLLDKGAAALAREVAAAIAEFERALDLDTKTGAILHAAKNFGLIYAGGLQAIGAGLLPLTPQQLLNRIKLCFEDALAAMPLPDAIERRARALLLSALSNTEWLPRENMSRETLGQAGVGFKYKENGRTVYTVTFETFEAWFEGNRALRLAALGWLHRRSLLRLKKGANPVREKFTNESYTKYVKVEGTNRRTIQFYAPRVLKKSSE